MGIDFLLNPPSDTDPHVDQLSFSQIIPHDYDPEQSLCIRCGSYAVLHGMAHKTAEPHVMLIPEWKWYCMSCGETWEAKGFRGRVRLERRK